MKIRLDYSIYKLINKEKNSIEKFGDKLSSLNPIEIINKGYAIIDKDKAIITTINEISADDIVNIKLSDGIATAKIISVRNEDRKNEKK
jgi:exodeoxyribonuclease VII large subunit